MRPMTGARLRAAIAAALAAVLAAAPTSSAQQSPFPPLVLWFADTVLYNGRVVPLDIDNPARVRTAQAIAMRNGKVIGTGSNESILRLAGPDTDRIDLEDRMVIPGIIDTHSPLMDYAIFHWAAGGSSPLRGATEEVLWDEVRASVLVQVTELVAQAQPGEWIEVRFPPRVLDRVGQRISGAQAIDEGMFTAGELDELAPDNPVLVGTASRGIVNSRAMALWDQEVGEPLAPSGYADQSHLSQIGSLMLAIDQLAKAYKREQEEWAAYGITTWSSPTVNRVVQAFQLLDRRGEMPIRLAYGPRDPLLAGPEKGPAMVKAYQALWPGQGSDYLWYHGLSLQPEGPYPSLGTTAASRREDIRPAQSLGPGSAHRAVLEQIVATGSRLVNTPVGGDGTLDAILDVIEQASAHAGLSLEEIRARRHAIDDLAMNPRPDQIPRLKRVGIMASGSPRSLEGEVDEMVQDFGPEVAAWNVPMQSLVSAGVRTVYELGSHDVALRGLFHYLELLVTRVSGSGAVWKPEERLDRATVLYVATRWAAEYVMREDVLGSLEPGKWADLLVLNRDYFAVPEDEISTIRPLLTMVGGRIVYEDPQLRGRAVGYQISWEWE